VYWKIKDEMSIFEDLKELPSLAHSDPEKNIIFLS